MGYTKATGEFVSSDGESRIGYCIFIPDTIPTAVLQISHGMCEYAERYEREGFVSAMTDAGFAVCASDHVGHGALAQKAGTLGFFTDYRVLSDDLHILNGIVRRTYRSLPYILLGHSMGSFVVREYIVKYSDIDGAIICGTSAGNQPLGLAKCVASFLARVRGERYVSKALARLSFGGYNKRFAGEKDSDSWLCSDPEVRKRYRADKLCDFIFTVSAYRELFTMLSDVTDGWAEKVPQSLPVFLISGEDDPLGDYGEGIKEVYGRLEDAELCNLGFKLYSGGRHEILFDRMKNDVCADVAKWVREVSEGVYACRGVGVSVNGGGSVR